MNLTYSVEQQMRVGDKRGFETVLKSLNITYSDYKPIPMAGSIYLFDCSVPKESVLPDFISEGIPEFIESHYFLSNGESK